MVWPTLSFLGEAVCRDVNFGGMNVGLGSAVLTSLEQEYDREVSDPIRTDQ